MNYKIGYLYGVVYSTLPSICMAIFVIFERSNYSFAFVVSTLLFWVLLSTIISFITIAIFGMTMVKLLDSFNFINIFSLTISGMVVSLIMLLFSGVNNSLEFSNIIFITSGMLGGFGFWFGLRK